MSGNRPTMIMDRIKTAFNCMGRNNGIKVMAPPAFKKNTAAVAWEYHVARELERAARARKLVAESDAVQAGVIFDSAVTPGEPGTESIIYDDDFVQVQVKVNKATESLDAKKLMMELEKRGVAPSVLCECVAASTKFNKPAHVFRTIMKGGAPTEGK